MKNAIIITLSLFATSSLFAAAHPLATDGSKHFASFMRSKRGPLKFVVPSSNDVQSFFKKLKKQNNDKKPLLERGGILWKVSSSISEYDGKLELSSVEFIKHTGFEHTDEVTGDIFVTYTDSNNPNRQIKLELFPRRIPTFDYNLQGGDLKYASFSRPSIQKFMVESQTPNDIVFSGTPKKIDKKLYNIIDIKSTLTLVRVRPEGKK